MIKNGAGSLTIGTSNSFSGGTTLNAGVFNLNSLSAAGIGPLTINGGTLTSNFAQSVTSIMLAGGLFNVNDPGALGGGTLTIGGGTLGNTSGALVAVTSGNPQSWNADIVFAGPYDLNLGSGAVTLGGSSHA